MRRYWKLWFGSFLLLVIAGSLASLLRMFPERFSLQQRAPDRPSALQTSADFDPAALYLTWRRDPSSTMIICWQTVEGTAADAIAQNAPVQLEYQKLDDLTWQLATGSSTPMPHSSRTTHKVELTGLQPDTTYRFHFGPRTRSYTFRTMPRRLERPIRFVAGGDTMHSKSWFERVNRRILPYQPDFVVMGGDLAYDDARPEQIGRWYDWLDACKSTLITERGRVIPIVVGIGNHEVRGGFGGTAKDAPIFHHLFPFPGSTGYGVLDFGQYLSLILLDTGHTAPVEGTQTQWLAQTLQTRNNVTHVFPVHHVPAYPGFRKLEEEISTQIRRNWSPLYETNRVRVVFENHDHLYKRTYPLKAGQKTDADSGVTYIGDGAWGVRTRPPKMDRWYLEKGENKRHFILVTLEERQQNFTVIDEDGNVIDRYESTSAVGVAKNR